MKAGASIVLLMKNHRHYIEKSWDIIDNQDYDGPVEYIYIDSGSTDGSLEFMAERGVEAHSIDPADFHHARTRNLAASRAAHEILVFLSADAVPAGTSWLRNLLEPFADARIAGTYGRQIAPPEIGPVRTFGMKWEYPDTPQVRDLSEGARLSLGMLRMSNANSAIRAEVWERFRFDESVFHSEDMGMCRDILTHGMKVAYVPDAVVVHCHEKTLWQEFQMSFDSGISLKRLGILGNPEYGSEAGYGIKRAAAEFKHFASRRMVGAVFGSLAANAAKWAGVQFGKRGDSLPRWLAASMSAGMDKDIS